MKSQTLLTLAAVASAGFSLGQATATSVGYSMQALAASNFNVVGLNAHTSPLLSGAYATVSGADLTGTNLNFTTALPSGKMCILEIITATSAPLVIGTVQEFETWSGSEINASTAISVVAVERICTVRVATTLQEIFLNGWRTTLTVFDDSGAVSADVNLTTGYLIQKMSSSKVVSIDVPVSYFGL